MKLNGFLIFILKRSIPGTFNNGVMICKVDSIQNSFISKDDEKIIFMAALG